MCILGVGISPCCSIDVSDSGCDDSMCFWQKCMPARKNMGLGKGLVTK